MYARALSEGELDALLGPDVFENHLEDAVGHPEPLRDVGVVVVSADLVGLLEGDEIDLPESLVRAGEQS